MDKLNSYIFCGVYLLNFQLFHKKERKRKLKICEKAKILSYTAQIKQCCQPLRMPIHMILIFILLTKCDMKKITNMYQKKITNMYHYLRIKNGHSEYHIYVTKGIKPNILQTKHILCLGKKKIVLSSIIHISKNPQIF